LSWISGSPFGGVVTPKGISSECTLSVGTVGLHRNFFPESCARKTGKTAVFGPGSVHISNFPNFSRQQTALSTHLWVCYRDRGDPSYTTGIMVHVGYYRKKRGRFPAANAPFGSNWTDSCVCVIVPFQLCCCIAQLHCNTSAVVRLSLVTNKGNLIT